MRGGILWFLICISLMVSDAEDFFYVVFGQDLFVQHQCLKVGKMTFLLFKQFVFDVLVLLLFLWCGGLTSS